MKARLTILLALVALAIPVSADEPAYECRGNEPFWSLRFNGNDAVYEKPDDPGISITQLTGVMKSSEQGWRIWRGEIGGWGDTSAFITATECEDSMSGRPSPFTVLLSFPNGDVLQGCCDCKKNDEEQ